MKKIIFMIIFMFFLTGCLNQKLTCRQTGGGLDFTRVDSFTFNWNGSQLKTFETTQYTDRAYTDRQREQICRPYEKREGVECLVSQRSTTGQYFVRKTYDFSILTEEDMKSMRLFNTRDEMRSAREKGGFICQV